MKQYLKITLIFLLAISLRIGFAAYTGIDKPNFDFNYDSAEYHHIALNLSQQKGFRIDKDLTSKRAPLYPLFLAGIYWLFGPEFWIVKIAQSLLGALTCLLIYFTAKEVYSARVGFWAMLCGAVFPHFIFYSAYLLSETLFQFLLMLFILLMCMLEDDFSAVRLVLSGLVLGIAVLCRPVVVMFPIFLFFWYLIFHQERLQGMVNTLVLGICMIMIILPWTARNYLVYEEIIPLTTQNGVTLYGGNNLDVYKSLKTRGGWLPPKNNNRWLTEPQINKKYWKMTLEFWRNNVKETLILIPFKFYRFWNPWPQAPFYFQLVSLLSFGPVLLLFFYYLFFSAEKGQENLLPIIGLIAYFTLFSLVVYGSTRFRFPIEPLLIILAVKSLIKDRKITSTTSYRSSYEKLQGIN